MSTTKVEYMAVNQAFTKLFGFKC